MSINFKSVEDLFDVMADIYPLYREWKRAKICAELYELGVKSFTLAYWGKDADELCFYPTWRNGFEDVDEEPVEYIIEFNEAFLIKDEPVAYTQSMMESAHAATKLIETDVYDFLNK